MAFIIDTNIAIHARDGTDAVFDKLEQHDGAVLLSSLSLAELQRGVFKDPRFTALRQARRVTLAQHSGSALRPSRSICLWPDHRAMRMGQRTRFRSHDRRACNQQPFRSGN